MATCGCEEGKDCRPCGCADCPDPVMPVCNVLLPDGTYTNATVTVQEGCVVQVNSGSAPQYAPTVDCCAPSATTGGSGGGGGGGGDCDCPPGPPGPAGANGAAASVNVASYSLVPATSPLNIWDSNSSPSIADLNFEIPECDCSGGGGGAETSGETSDVAGITIEDGLVKSVPDVPVWPPVMKIIGFGNPVTDVVVTIDDSQKATLGLVGITVDLTSITDRITDLENTVADLKTAINCMITESASTCSSV